jgi:hypothetical protein
MKTIKLSEWCEKTGIKYLTAWRWFKSNNMPVHAYQTDSGTILVEDSDDAFQNTSSISLNNSGDAMSLFLKKTVEYSKSDSSVEDFAAYVISNFQLKLNGTIDTPKYSKNRPKQEEVQKHFQQFLPNKEETDRLKAIIPSLKEQTALFFTQLTDQRDLNSESDISTYNSQPGSLTVNKSIDLNMTSQVNSFGSATSDINSVYSSCESNNGLYANIGGTISPFYGQPSAVYLNSLVSAGTPFQPTEKELLASTQVIETVETENLPRKRGRKPTIKRDNK